MYLSSFIAFSLLIPFIRPTYFIRFGISFAGLIKGSVCIAGSVKRIPFHSGYQVLTPQVALKRLMCTLLTLSRTYWQFLPSFFSSRTLQYFFQFIFIVIFSLLKMFYFLQSEHKFLNFPFPCITLNV